MLSLLPTTYWNILLYPSVSVLFAVTSLVYQNTARPFTTPNISFRSAWSWNNLGWLSFFKQCCRLWLALRFRSHWCLLLVVELTIDHHRCQKMTGLQMTINHHRYQVVARRMTGDKPLTETIKNLFDNRAWYNNCYPAHIFMRTWG